MLILMGYYRHSVCSQHTLYTGEIFKVFALILTNLSGNLSDCTLPSGAHFSVVHSVAGVYGFTSEENFLKNLEFPTRKTEMAHSAH